MLLELQNIEKKFDSRPILQNVSLTIPAGEILSLLGPSGSGKTTLLRIIAGLEQADSGRILLEGQELSGIPVHRRGFGYVFQEYALFPHKNVGENVAFGLRMQEWERARIEARVQEVLALVGLDGFGGRPIHQLSGGEQQRVALARSLAPAPRLLLLDEPLGALDRVLRERLMVELRDILKQAGLKQAGADITAIYVTHDQGEAFAVADRVAIMNDGRIEQLGAPLDLYRWPRTPFVARFLGMENVLAGDALPRLKIGKFQPGQRVLIRPEAARLLSPEEAATAANVLEAQLLDVSFRGRYQVATVLPNPTANIQNPILKFDFDSAVTLPPTGSSLFLSLDPAEILLLE